MCSGSFTSDEDARRNDAKVLKASTREAVNQRRVPCLDGQVHDWRFAGSEDVSTSGDPDREEWVHNWTCAHCGKHVTVKPKPVNHAALVAPRHGRAE